VSRRFQSVALVLCSAFAAWGFGACGDRASGETQAGASASAKPGSSGKSACPTMEQVNQAAGFEVRFVQSIGTTPDTWVACQYEMTGRYRGTFLEVMGEPAAKADSVFGEMKQAVKGMKGVNADLDQLDIGSPGWGYGSNSLSEAAAVVGPHVWHAKLEYLMAEGIGDQKDAMVRVLKLVAR
jgi:hypothetical protein